MSKSEATYLAEKLPDHIAEAEGDVAYAAKSLRKAKKKSDISAGMWQMRLRNAEGVLYERQVRLAEAINTKRQEDCQDHKFVLVLVNEKIGGYDYRVYQCYSCHAVCIGRDASWD